MKVEGKSKEIVINSLSCSDMITCLYTYKYLSTQTIRYFNLPKRIQMSLLLVIFSPSFHLHHHHHLSYHFSVVFASTNTRFKYTPPTTRVSNATTTSHITSWYIPITSHYHSLSFFHVLLIHVQCHTWLPCASLCRDRQ